MFLRTFKVFLALVMLALVTVLAFALSGRRGPGDALTEAAEHFARGEYLRVVTELARIKQGYSVQRDPNKLRDLLRLSYRAHQALGNAPPALHDLDELLAMIAEPDEDLRLDHVRLLALCDQGGKALREAREFLQQHPGHWRALELAGEACQTLYQPERTAILAGIDLEVDVRSRDAARSAAFAWIYRPEGDIQVQEAMDQLQAIYRADTRTAAQWARLQTRLRDLRVQVQTALTYFAESLEHDGKQVAAFRGLALSLGQSRRLYDLMILCELYRRRFHHEYVMEAGETAAFDLLRTGQDAAALATTLRWFPRGAANDETVVPQLGEAAVDVLLARIVAAWRLADRPALESAGADARALAKADRRTSIASALVGALSQSLGGDSERTEQTFQWATGLVLARPQPENQIDLLEVLMPARIANLQRHNAADPRIPELYTAWARARPASLEPLLGLAEQQFANSQPEAAMVSLEAAQKIDRTDERVLALRIRVARAQFAASEQDGISLLRQCIGRGSELPDVRDPTGFVLCAEAALDAPLLPVAFACARAAIEAFPWSRVGRVLELRAALASGNAKEAVRLAEQATAAWPDDPQIMTLALAARQAAGKPATDLLWRALAVCPPDPRISALVLRASATDAPAQSAPLLLGLDVAKLPAELAVWSARALAREGKGAEAMTRLRAIPVAERGAPELRAALAETLLAAIIAQTAAAPDADVAATFVAAATEFEVGDDAVPALLATAAELANTAPATAYEIVTLALAHATPKERNGAAYALAGRIALERGQLLQAESHWTAAIAFPDGRDIAEDLARLCFANERPERALQVYALATRHADAALALRCGNLAEARALLLSTLTADPSNFLAHATVAGAGLPSGYADLAAPDAAARDELMTALSLLHEPALAHLALPTLSRLAANGDRGSAQLLLAHGYTAAGKVRAAASLHQALFRRGYVGAEFWREVCEAAADPTYPMDGDLAEALATAAAQQKLTAAPYAVAFATARTAAAMTQAGHRAMALQLMVPVWVTYDAEHPFPPSATPTLQDAEEVLALGRPLDAWWILDRVRPTLRGDARDRCTARMIELAERLTADPTTRNGTLYAAMATVCAGTEVRGGAVHYLLRHAAEFPQIAPDRAATLRLLHAHIDYAAGHPDEDVHVPATVRELVARDGLDAALQALETALAAHPAALSLWLARSNLLRSLRRGAEGIAELRTVLQHMTSPRTNLELVVLAAAESLLGPGDGELLAACPPELRNAPRGRLAQGLVALFGPKPERAVDLLTGGKVDGGTDSGDEPLRLLALAQALLASARPDAEARAAAALQQLATDYPSSSEARYAGSFVLQLAPR